MKELGLTNSTLKALVDDDVYEIVKEFEWKLSNGYAFCSFRRYAKTRRLGLHQLVGGKFCDHKNRNRLDCQRHNLRQATQSQNLSNTTKRQGNFTSKYKGVRRYKTKWYASIQVNRKQYHLGSFINESDAAQAYNIAAVKYFGEFAFLNTIEE
jgi:hypothetical protein